MGPEENNGDRKNGDYKNGNRKNRNQKSKKWGPLRLEIGIIGAGKMGS